MFLRFLKKGKLLYFTLVSISSIFLIILSFLILNAIFPLPDPYLDRDFAKVVVDKDGKPLRYFLDSKGELRYKVSIDEVSPKYIEALIGYEDRYYRLHYGINPVSIFRSFYQLLRDGKVISGGSTLTMQTARLISPHKKTIVGKIYQAFRAIQLEYKYSKDEILELYFNLAPFGGNIKGVAAASYIYFNRDISEINDSEAALLAVLPQAPSLYRPDRYPEKARDARDKVAKRLLKYGYWDSDKADTVLNDPLIFFRNNNRILAGNLAERLIGKNSSSYKIETYIDSNLQEYVEERLSSNILTYPEGVSAAIIIVDNSNYSVIAYAGSAIYGSTERFGYIDMVRAIRSPGSSLKPFIYAIALDEKLIHSKSLLIDTPRYFSTYKAGNFYGNFNGPVPADNALQRSLNIPVIQLLEHITPDYFYSSILNTGVSLPLLGNKPNLSIALGGVGITLESLATLYTAFSNDGKVHSLLFEKDDTYYERPLISKESAYIIYEILRRQSRGDAIFNESVTGLTNKLAWKTGTSYGNRDSIAVAFNKRFTIAVWIGRPDNTPVYGAHGGVSALPLAWSMSEYLESNFVGDSQLTNPGKVTEVEICWPSGLASDSIDNFNCHEKYIALTIDDITPATLSEEPDKIMQTYLEYWLESSDGKRVNRSCYSGNITEKSAHFYPRLVEPWVKYRYVRDAIIPEWSDGCQDSRLYLGSIIITGIENGSILKVASYENRFPELELSASGGVGNISWYLNGEYVGYTKNNLAKRVATKIKGDNILIAIDENNNYAVSFFYVD